MKTKYLFLIIGTVLFLYAIYLSISIGFLDSYTVFMLSFVVLFIYKLKD